MVCVHLKELYQLMEQNDLRIGSTDLIRIACRQCEELEVCPSMLTEHYDEQVAQRSGSPENVEDKSEEESK